jgi:Uma2 family endonuclease
VSLTAQRQQTQSRRFTVDEFHRMAEVGIFTEDDRVELVEGEIITMTPVGSRHAACVKRFLRELPGQLAGRALLDAQNPIELSDESELYPDVVLLKPRRDAYEAANPTSRDVFLVVEVSDTTLAHDQRSKVPIYAREGVAEVWVVDLAGEKVWVYRRPGRDGYQEMRAFARGETLGVHELPDITFGVDDILG